MRPWPEVLVQEEALRQVVAAAGRVRPDAMSRDVAGVFENKHSTEMLNLLLLICASVRAFTLK
jgi:hypothetical protein